MATSAISINWQCLDCHGDYNIPIRERIKNGFECPYCSNKQLLRGFNSLSDIYPNLIKIWSISNTRLPNDVLVSSNSKWLWICKVCKGEYKATIQEQSNRKHSCPYCSGKKLLSGYNSFDVLYPELMKEWDYLSNILLAHPKEVKSSNQQNVWWICKNNPEHRYKMPIKRIIFEKRSKEPCLFCKGRRRKREHFVPYK